MSDVFAVIPIRTDEAMAKFEMAEKLLREVSGDQIDLAKWQYFVTAPIQIGNVKFMDCRGDKA